MTFQVNQRVYHNYNGTGHGFGRVIDVTPDTRLPYRVRFDSGFIADYAEHELEPDVTLELKPK
jgi:hypothetical protein